MRWRLEKIPRPLQSLYNIGPIIEEVRLEGPHDWNAVFCFRNQAGEFLKVEGRIFQAARVDALQLSPPAMS